MNNQDHLHIHHILESIARINEYVGADKESLSHDRKTYDAVLRNLQTLSESAQKISDNVKDKYPNIEWNKIAGFRNILVHDYLGDLDADLIWTVIEVKLPELQQVLKQEIPE